MTNADINLRLRQYTPLGDPAGIIPDLGISLVAGPDGPTLQATISTTIYGTLPDDCEVAVEVWSAAQDAWVEGRDSRFVLLTQGADDRDTTGTVTLTGVGLLQWLGQKASLAGVEPYSKGGSVEALISSSTVHVSGATFTWAGHGMAAGDRVRITAKGHSKGLSTGSVYYVRNATSSTFQLSHTPTGAIKSFGSATDVGVQRIRTRILFSGGHSFAKNEAVSVVDADGSNLTDGSQYYVVNPTASTLQVASKPGGLPIELGSNVLTVYRYLDGQRVWKNATPGLIIENAFLEARARGWGQDAGGSDQVFMSWSAAGDSNSLAWPARVDDPTVTGVSIGFQPGTSLWAMVQFLLDNGWAEFASHGRTLDLFAPNTGYDWSDNAGFVVRIGATAQQVDVTKDLSDYRTVETVRGEANIEVTATVSPSPWGRLEQYVTASGVTTTSHARSYGYNDLGQHSKPAIGYSVTEAAASADYVPVLNYQRGDWVQAQVKGVWTRLRVTQWTLAKDAQGVVTVTTLLEKRKRALLSKIAAATRKANGGRIAATTSTTPPESDKRKAAIPASLAVTARTTAVADKSTKGTVTATWLPVTSDGDGDDLVGAHYEVIVRADGQQYGQVVASTKATSADLSGHAAGQIIAVSVRAISSTGTPGEATDEVEFVVPAAEDIPDAPSTPAVTSTLGSIVVAWDGNLVDPTDGAHAPEVADAFAYVAVQRSTDGTTWTTEAQTLAAAGQVTDLGLTVGSAYQYRLVAVSQLGVSSAPSPVASATVVGVDTAQINADFTQQVTDASNAAANAETIADQANTAAGEAQAAANGKTTTHYSTAAASGAGTVAGDLWFQVDASGHIVAQWTWNGTAWASNLITGAVLTNLDAGSISTGTLNAARIASGSIAVTQLAVTDLTNLYPDPLFGGDFGGTGPLSFKYTGTDQPKGNAWVVANRDNIASSGQVSVKAGDAFYIEADVKTLQGSAALSLALFVANATGGAGGSDSPAWQGYSTLSNYQGSGTVVDYGTGWTRRWWRFVIPSTWTNVDHGYLYAQINQAGNLAYSAATAYALGNVVIRRLAAGNLVVDGSITGTKLAATAIDAMTITGATFRTASTAKTSGGVQMDSTGLHGYNASGASTFALDTAGNLSLSAGSAVLNSNGLTVKPVGSVNVKYGAYADQDATFYGMDFAVDPTGGTTLADAYSHLGVTANGSQMTMRSAGGLTLKSNWDGTSSATHMSDLNLGYDTGGPLVSSQAILNRLFASANTTPNTTDRRVLVIDPNGIIGNLAPTATLFHQQAYADVISTRAVYTSSSGHFGTTASSRRVKDLHQHLKMDDTAMEAWLKLPTWEFQYKDGVNLAPEDRGKRHHGLVAEEVHDAGFTNLVYYEEREGHPHKGRVEGVAYERMGVYNRMAIQRLYARLTAAEEKLAQLEANR